MNQGLIGDEIKVGLSAIELARPAIIITERDGDKEITHEFATSEDYKAWKELE